MQEQDRSQHLIAVDDSAALASTIERARAGATRSTLAAALVDADISGDEADAFVGELIDSQILVPDLECPVTGREPLGHLIDLLRRAPEGESVAQELARVADALASLDRDGVGADPGRYRSIARRLDSLPARVDPARLFQFDLVRPASVATLDRALVEEIIRGADVLRRLTPGGARDRIDDDQLARFRAAFTARYEQREVPLVEAMDEESGVGGALIDGGTRDASPLLRGLDFPATPISMEQFYLGPSQFRGSSEMGAPTRMGMVPGWRDLSLDTVMTGRQGCWDWLHAARFFQSPWRLTSPRVATKVASSQPSTTPQHAESK